MPLIQESITVDQFVLSHKGRLKALCDSFSLRCDSLAKEIWTTKDGITPEMKVAAYGAEAKALFNLCSACATLVYQATGTVKQIVPPGYLVSFNADGSANVTYTAPNPEPADSLPGSA